MYIIYYIYLIYYIYNIYIHIFMDTYVYGEGLIIVFAN